MPDKRLTSFLVSPAGNEFQLRVEVEGSEPLIALASYDQLDLLAEQIDELLDQREEAQEVKN